MEILNKSEKCANIPSCKMAVFLQCIRKYNLSLTNNIIYFEQLGPFTIKIKELQQFEKKRRIPVSHHAEGRRDKKWSTFMLEILYFCKALWKK